MNNKNDLDRNAALGRPAIQLLCVCVGGGGVGEAGALIGVWMTNPHSWFCLVLRTQKTHNEPNDPKDPKGPANINNSEVLVIWAKSVAEFSLSLKSKSLTHIWL